MKTTWLALLSLLLLPLCWLWPCVVGGRVFEPYDTAQFPPVSLTLSPQQLAQSRAGANFDVTEPPVWFRPELQFAGEELRAGRLPTWNPHARGGAPLHAHGLLGLCYPPTWLLLAFADPAPGLVYLAWLNLALGGLLAFGLLRRLGLAVLPAWFGALLFELSGPMASNAYFWMRLGSYVWLPGVLWAVLALARADRVRPLPVAALGGSFALAWLAGFPPFAATTSLLGAAFAAWLLAARARSDGLRRTRAPALGLLAGFALGGLLALPQVLPSLQFFPHSARPTTPAYSDIAAQAFEGYGLLGYVLPDAIGHPTAQEATPYPLQNVLGLLWNTRLDAQGKPALPNYNYTEYAVFVGQLGLVLALFGALAGRGRPRAFALLAWALCAGLALFLPGVRALFALPLVENVWPLRWLAPATLFVAWLAAVGLDCLLAAARRAPLVLAALTGAAAAAALLLALQQGWQLDTARSDWVPVLAAKYGTTADGVVNHVQGLPAVGLDRFAAARERLAGELLRGAGWLLAAALWLLAVALRPAPRDRTWLGVAAGLLAALQLGLHGSTVTHGAARAIDPTTPVHTFLRERAAALADQGGITLVRGATEPVLQTQLPPGQLPMRGLRDLHFYSHFDRRSLQPLQHLLGPTLGARLAAKGYLTGALPHTLPPPGLDLEFRSGLPRDGYVTAHPFEHPLLDLLGARYVLSVGDAPLPHAGTPVAIPGAPPGFHVQERPTALPRAFAVDAVQATASDEDVVQAMLAPDFAPRRRSFALASELPPAPPPAPPDAPAREVRFVTDHPARIELAVAAGAQPWLLLTDTFLPGWTATVDGVEVPIVRANHAFRLVRLPPDACRVGFTYRAPGLVPGLLLAAAGAAAWLLWVFATRRTASTAARTS